jgi:hypothetical protein
MIKHVCHLHAFTTGFSNSKSAAVCWSYINVIICVKKSNIYFANFERSSGIKSSIVRIGVQLVKTDGAAGAPSHSRQALVCIVVTYDENLKKIIMQKT